MLYDPQTEIKHNLLGFIEWLKQQPPEQTYCYTDSQNCALAQYLKAQGKTEFDDYCLPSEGTKNVLGPDANYILNKAGDSSTFGACLRRAKQAYKRFAQP